MLDTFYKHIYLTSKLQIQEKKFFFKLKGLKIGKNCKP